MTLHISQFLPNLKCGQNQDTYFSLRSRTVYHDTFIGMCAYSKWYYLFKLAISFVNVVMLLLLKLRCSSAHSSVNISSGMADDVKEVCTRTSLVNLPKDLLLGGKIIRQELGRKPWPKMIHTSLSMVFLAWYDWITQKMILDNGQCCGISTLGLIMDWLIKFHCDINGL